MKTKELKEIYFERYSNAQDWYDSKITPLKEIILAKNQETHELLKNSLREKLFPSHLIEHYQKLKRDGFLDEKKMLGRLSLHIDKVKDPEVKKRYEKLRDEVKEARKKALDSIDKKGRELHFNLMEYRPIEAVECIFPTGEKTDTKPINRLQNFPKYLVSKHDFLYLQIDLSHDKEDILHLCDDIISKAQEFIGKTGESAITRWKDKIFDKLFLKHYLSGMSKTKALEKVQEDFSNLGIHIEAESFNKRYLPRFKKRYEIKDIRQLKKGDFHSFNSPPT